MTQGIVSNVIGDRSKYTISAKVNPGNSGGAAFHLDDTGRAIFGGVLMEMYLIHEPMARVKRWSSVMESIMKGYNNEQRYLLSAMNKLNGKIMNKTPEYEDCKKAAEKNQVPLKEIYKEIKFKITL